MPPSVLARRLLRSVVVGTFAVMVAAAILQVASRYVFNHPLGWTEEVAKLMLVWWTFLAVGLLAVDRKLLAVDALLLPLGARAAHLLLALGQALCVAVSGWLTWLAARLVLLAGNQITPSLDIPYAWVYLSLPVGLLVATVGFAGRTLHHGRAALAPAPDHPLAGRIVGDA